MPSSAFGGKPSTVVANTVDRPFDVAAGRALGNNRHLHPHDARALPPSLSCSTCSQAGWWACRCKPPNRRCRSAGGAIGDAETTVHRLSVVERLLRNPHSPDELGHQHAGFRLPQREGNLLVCVPRFLHFRLLGRRLLKAGKLSLQKQGASACAARSRFHGQLLMQPPDFTSAESCTPR